LIVNHVCYECGFKGEAFEKDRKIKCPQCEIVNDVWFEGEEPPLNHR
jgi:phage FluMu protein Com